jgi:cellulose synthase/poly-beta-1,6-N-acetylglucosamine synthase-like glycosyltransferase
MTSFGLFLLAVPVIVGLYAYLVYPLVLWLVAKPRVIRASSATRPTVTVVLPAYNEERQIAGALDCLVQQQYPKELLQVIVVSDASTDRTDEIVQQYTKDGVELLRMTTRGGKTAGENAALAIIRGDIVVNTDASIRLAPETIEHLIRPFADPRIGVASSRDVSISQAPSNNAAEGGYVGYEMWVRDLETRAGGIIGASGSGYAIRSELHRHPVRADLSRDFSAALTARRHGFIAISVPDAVCYVPRTGSLRAEFRRKVRTISRGIETLMYNRGLLNPIAHGVFAWKLWSHKLLRWAVPPAVALSGVGIALAWSASPIVRVIGALYVFGLGVTLAALSWPETRLPRALAVIAFPLAGNLAVVFAIARVLLGHEDHVWEPTRRA